MFAYDNGIANARFPLKATITVQCSAHKNNSILLRCLDMMPNMLSSCYGALECRMLAFTYITHQDPSSKTVFYVTAQNRTLNHMHYTVTVTASVRGFSGENFDNKGKFGYSSLGCQLRESHMAGLQY